MNEFPVVLVINCGSSSIKFSVLDASSCDVLMAGIADGINSENAFLSINDGEPVKLAQRNYEGALKAIAFELEKRSLIDSVALIGHRIAHGGNIFTQSVVITEEVIDNIRRVSPLAPLHNYANLSGIASAQQLFPGSGRWRCLIPASTRRWRQRPISMGCRGSILRSSACAATVFTAPRIAMSLSGRRPCWRCRKRIPGWLSPTGQRCLYLRRAQRAERGYLNGDDAAGRAHDGHPLWRCRLRRHGMDRLRNQPDPQRP